MVGIVLIIAIAINLLQPFGMNELHINYKYLLLWGSGVIYVFCLISVLFEFEKFYKVKWTVKSKIVASWCLFLFLAFLIGYMQ